MDDERETHEEEEEEEPTEHPRPSDGRLARALVWVQLAAASADLVWSVVEAVRTFTG